VTLQNSVSALTKSSTPPPTFMPSAARCKVTVKGFLLCVTSVKVINGLLMSFNEFHFFLLSEPSHYLILLPENPRNCNWQVIILR
jgi:hypothetical protein